VEVYVIHIPLQSIERDGRCPIAITDWDSAVEAALNILDETIGEDRRTVPFQAVLAQYGVTDETWMARVNDPNQWPPLPRPIRLTPRKKIVLAAELERFQAALLATEKLGLHEPQSIPTNQSK
jgi:hypothetical protein